MSGTSHKNVNATIVGPVPLGTGAATAAKQDTQITAEQAIQTLLGGTGALKDNHAGWTTIIGVSGGAVVSADLTSRTVVTDAPAAKLVITDIIVSVDTAMSVLFEEETSNTDILKIFIPANGTVQITPRGKLKLATTAKKLAATASVAGNISILVLGYSEA